MPVGGSWTVTMQGSGVQLGLKEPSAPVLPLTKIWALAAAGRTAEIAPTIARAHSQLCRRVPDLWIVFMPSSIRVGRAVLAALAALLNREDVFARVGIRRLSIQHPDDHDPCARRGAW